VKLDYKKWRNEMQLTKLFSMYMEERTFLKNASPLSIKSNKICWLRFEKVMGEKRLLKDLDKALLKEFVIGLRELELSPTTCNITIRELNTFLKWLFDNEFTPTQLKMQQLKVEKKVKQDFTDEEIKRFINWKPSTWFQNRLYALIMTLVDSGIRIDEALTLKRSDVDFYDMTIKVKGKGNKERIVPFSLELRKVLWKFAKTHPHDLMFSTQQGHKLSYHNMLRELKELAADLRITNEDVGFHQFRYGFALNYIRQGGDAFRLQRVMGHATIATTQGYVRLLTSDLKEAHIQTSRLKKLQGG
jgi:integrase/recombinase XerD